MVTPFRSPCGIVLQSGQPVQTFTSPDGWANVGLTIYDQSRVIGQQQVGYNSNPCPTGGAYRTYLYDPRLGYVGYYARAEGCWSGSYFPGASPVSSFWGSWYAPPQPVGPIYAPVYEYGFFYEANAYPSNGSSIAQRIEPPFNGPWFSSVSARDAEKAKWSTQILGLLVCNPETECQCGPSLKTADPCCVNCAEMAARLNGLASAIQSAANLTQAKADQLIAQAAENRKKQPE